MKAMTAMRDTVLGSKLLQQSIGLLIPDSSADFKRLFWSEDGIIEYTPDVYEPLGPEIFKLKRPTPGLSFCGFVFDSFDSMYAQSFDFRFDRIRSVPGGPSPPGPGDLGSLTTAYFTITGHGDFPLEKIGSRVAALSPTSVPIEEMSIIVHCDCCTSNWDNPPTCAYPASFKCTAKSNDRYITMGDLQNATIEARTEHYSKCKNQYREHKAKCRVEFVAEVPLKADDPIMISRKDGFDGDEYHKAWRRYQGLPEYLEESDDEAEEESDEETSQFRGRRWSI